MADSKPATRNQGEPGYTLSAEKYALAVAYNRGHGLSDPAPPEFVRWWLFDHPPANERIVFFRTYDPWTHGGEPRYVK